MLWVLIRRPCLVPSNEYHSMCFLGEIRKNQHFLGWKKKQKAKNKNKKKTLTGTMDMARMLEYLG